MKEAKEITLSVNDRGFTMDVSIRDTDLIEAIFDSLTAYVKKGFSIKVKQTYMNAPSDSVKIISKIISSDQKMDEWRDETKQLISILRKGE